jgi:nitroreductase/NAD-dependent dihydropyrimidine dehydrogenase PreA subunit
MNWVRIDKSKCTECGLCLSICLRCFHKGEGSTEVFANEENCNLCGHCVAICPAGAVLHDRMDMSSFTEIDREAPLEHPAFIKFLQGRRSHRNFLEKPVPREIMERLLGACRLAPTGSNVQNVEVLILTDRQKIDRLIDVTVDYYRQLIPKVEKKVENLKGRREAVPPDLQWAWNRARRNKTVVRTRESGGDPIFRGAHTILVFHSTPYTSTPKDNCVIAAHTLALTAMTLGLESCYIGLFESAFRNDPKVSAELNLPATHQVFSVLVLGYPKNKFLRTVERKPLKVRWD